tara:strand:- start:55 stop:372 length:318 start_codon:yes stop_codon:yes gene_type:complete
LGTNDIKTAEATNKPRSKPRSKPRKWKNVISVGDAPHEREALFRITDRNHHPHCRVKSVKFMVKPFPADLLHQLNLLTCSMKNIVNLDSNLDSHYVKELQSFDDV